MNLSVLPGHKTNPVSPDYHYHHLQLSLGLDRWGVGGKGKWNCRKSVQRQHCSFAQLTGKWRGCGWEGDKNVQWKKVKLGKALGNPGRNRNKHGDYSSPFKSFSQQWNCCFPPHPFHIRRDEATTSFTFTRPYNSGIGNGRKIECRRQNNRNDEIERQLTSKFIYCEINWNKRICMEEWWIRITYWTLLLLLWFLLPPAEFVLGILAVNPLIFIAALIPVQHFSDFCWMGIGHTFIQKLSRRNHHSTLCPQLNDWQWLCFARDPNMLNRNNYFVLFLH